MDESLNVRIADRLIELAYALEDANLPLAARAVFVKRELALAAKELLDADGVQTARAGLRLRAEFEQWADGNGWPTTASETPHGPFYTANAVRQMWDAWQAAHGVAATAKTADGGCNS